MNRNFTFYFGILLVFCLLIWLVLFKGEALKPSVNNAAAKEIPSIEKPQLIPDKNDISASANHENPTSFQSVLDYFRAKSEHPVSILILQIIVIILFARVFGYLAGKTGQPTVTGEIVAGIFLGPSFIGYYFPGIFSFLFPAGSLKYLEMLSQIGLILFMFIIGMELDIKILKVKVKSALIISHTSIIIAFFLGVWLAYMLFETYAPAGSTFFGFALFIGIAMSIAAFPVLARIIQERGLTKTAFGKLVITIAAIDDLTAWCILAAVIAVIRAGNPINAIFTVFLVAVYILIMLFIVQPLMKKVGSVYITKEIINKKIVAFVFIILLLSSLFTEFIGIKALFGAFLAGVIMPQNNNFKKIMTEKIEDFSLVILLPIFFVFTGLRTQLRIISDDDLWLVCGLVTLFAIAGKFGGSFIAAFFTKRGLKDSLLIGALMNTRGLMQLIVINIGYDIGILSPQVFTMMVIMTLITTFMTVPVMNLVNFITRKKEVIANDTDKRSLKVIISFGNPKMGASLLKIFYSLAGKDKSYRKITALHLTPHTEIIRSAAIKYEENSFAPIKATAYDLKMEINTIYKTTEDVTKEIIKTTRKEAGNLLLMGAAKSVFNKNMLGGRVKLIVDQCKCNAGVFIDKEIQTLKKTVVISDKGSLCNLADVSHRLAANSGSHITFMCPAKKQDIINPGPVQNIFETENTDIIDSSPLSLKFLNNYDLLVINIKYFEKEINDKKTLIDSRPSLLLINFTDDTFILPAESNFTGGA